MGSISSTLRSEIGPEDLKPSKRIVFKSIDFTQKRARTVTQRNSRSSKAWIVFAALSHICGVLNDMPASTRFASRSRRKAAAHPSTELQLSTRRKLLPIAAGISILVSSEVKADRTTVTINRGAHSQTIKGAPQEHFSIAYRHIQSFSPRVQWINHHAL